MVLMANEIKKFENWSCKFGNRLKVPRDSACVA
jgi:hypothetical protein